MANIHEEHKKGLIFVKRTCVIAILMFSLFVILIFRLTYLQVLKHEKYKIRSENNRIKTFVTPPFRGFIFDRNDKILSFNRKSYRIFLYRNNRFRYDKETVKTIAKILDLDFKAKAKIAHKLEKQKNQPRIAIVDNLTWNDLVKIEAHSYKLDDVSIESGYIRSYPYKEKFAHILGYVSIPTETEIPKQLNKKALFYHPDYRIGRVGIERGLEESLKGYPGFRNVEVNALGVPLRELQENNGTKGISAKLTVDANLQSYVYGRTIGENLAVIVMDVNTGEILSMVSQPSYDPNKFVEGLSNDYWYQLKNNFAKPLNNKAISARYPPGSVFKPVVALAALNNGWKSQKKLTCNGITWFNSRKFHCWREAGHGNLSLTEAIMQSCNIYFAKMGLKTGIDNISKMARKFGLQEKFDMNLPGVVSGLVPDKAWKKNRLNDVWVRGDTINASIGQGYLLATPLELVTMVSRIANGGYAVKPFVVYDSKIRKKNEEEFNKKPLVDSKYIDIVKRGMYDVVNKRKGTTYWHRIWKKGFEMAGKTGTSQVIAKEKKEFFEKQKDGLKKSFNNHALFIGFAPYDKPKYGIIVVAEHGGFGASAAAPIARDVLLFAQENEI